MCEALSLSALLGTLWSPGGVSLLKRWPVKAGGLGSSLPVSLGFSHRTEATFVPPDLRVSVVSVGVLGSRVGWRPSDNEVQKVISISG